MDQLLEIEILKTTKDTVELKPYELPSDTNGQVKKFLKTGIELNFSFKPPTSDPHSREEAAAKRDYLRKHNIHTLFDDIFQFLVKEQPCNLGLATAQYLYAKSEYQSKVVNPRNYYLGKIDPATVEPEVLKDLEKIIAMKRDVVAGDSLNANIPGGLSVANADRDGHVSPKLEINTNTDLPPTLYKEGAGELKVKPVSIPPLPVKVIEIKLDDERKRNEYMNKMVKKANLIKEHEDRVERERLLAIEEAENERVRELDRQERDRLIQIRREQERLEREKEEEEKKKYLEEMEEERIRRVEEEELRDKQNEMQEKRYREEFLSGIGIKGNDLMNMLIAGRKFKYGVESKVGKGGKYGNALSGGNDDNNGNTAGDSPVSPSSNKKKGGTGKNTATDGGSPSPKSGKSLKGLTGNMSMAKKMMGGMKSPKGGAKKRKNSQGSQGASPEVGEGGGGE